MIDLAIIGGGPAGYVAAERAGAKGLKVVLFEKRELGGVCLNEGCIPTKTLLYSAKIYDSAIHGDKYGVFAKDATFDFGKIVDRKSRVVRRLVAGVGAKMKAHGVQVVKGEAMIEGRSSEGIKISCNGEQFLAANLLICTGSEAFVPPIPGLTFISFAIASPKIISFGEVILILAYSPSQRAIFSPKNSTTEASSVNSLRKSVS